MVSSSEARQPTWDGRADRDSNAGRFVDGYFNPAGGWAESGRVVAWLLDEAARAGVVLHSGRRFARLIEKEHRVTGILDGDGATLAADHVVIAAGSWTGHLLPELSGALRSVGRSCAGGACPANPWRARSPTPARSSPIRASSCGR